MEAAEEEEEQRLREEAQAKREARAQQIMGGTQATHYQPTLAGVDLTTVEGPPPQETALLLNSPHGGIGLRVLRRYHQC